MIKVFLLASVGLVLGLGVAVVIILFSSGMPGTAGDSALGIAALPDGGLVVVGTTEMRGAGKRDTWVRRLDADGDEVWDRTYGGPGADWGIGIVPKDDGGFLLLGNDGSTKGAESHAWIVALDGDGETLWQRSIRHGKINSARSAHPVAEGWLVGGMGGHRGWVATLDEEGREKSHAIIGSGKSSSAFDTWPLEDGGAVLAGWTNWQRGRVANVRPRIVRLDAGGGEVWDVSLDWRGNFRALHPGPHGFVVVGKASAGTIGGNDAALVSVSTDGEVHWERLFGGPHTDEFVDLVPLDGGWVLVGSRGGPEYASEGWLMRFDSQWKPVWNRKYGSTGADHLEAAAAMPDGNIAAAGWSGERGDGERAWVLVVDPDGETVWERRYGPGAGDETAGH